MCGARMLVHLKEIRAKRLSDTLQRGRRLDRKRISSSSSIASSSHVSRMKSTRAVPSVQRCGKSHAKRLRGRQTSDVPHFPCEFVANRSETCGRRCRSCGA
ncbi:unnamed protein product [Amoebophrya sp. A25]|nr:unnamed protein product [Amoebophrya sp. A25]|eukprot:GSA25T00027770001.1